jgi:hypothetical protein
MVQRLRTWEEHRRIRWLSLALLVVLTIWGLTDVRQRARIDPENPTAHKTDFTVYTEAGAAFFDGRDPYEVSNPRGWHYLYPPLFAILVAPLASLGSQTQAVVWYFMSLAACFGVWRELRRLWTCVLSQRTADVLSLPRWLPWLALGAVALPALNCLQRGQVGIVLVYLLLFGLRLTVVHENIFAVFLGGIALALAATIKVTPLLPIGVLVLLLLAIALHAKGRYSAAIANGLARGPMNRALAAATGQGVGLLLFLFFIPALVIGHDANLAHLQTWVKRVGANDDVGLDNDFNSRSKRNQSLDNAVRRLGNRIDFALGGERDDQLVDDLAQQGTPMPMETPLVDRALRAIKLSLVALLLVVGWRVARRDDVTGLMAVFGLACAATLIVSPISWGHHYVMWLPALVFVPAWMWQNGRRALAIGMAEIAFVLVVSHYVVLDHAGRVGLLGIGAAIWQLVGTISLGWPPPVGQAVPAMPCVARYTVTMPDRRAA